MKKENTTNIVSIIIPIYNVEAYLEQCLDSVISQTYKNIEIILVDDGSKDKSGVIAEEYAKKDTRIRVVHKRNGGLSSARNAGIEIARGEYLFFLDSDDYIDIEIIEILIATANKYNAKLVECGMRKVYPDGTSEEEHTQKIAVMLGKEAVISFLDRRNCMKPVAGDSLYHRSIFDTVRFEEGRLHEDGWFKYKAFYLAGKVVVIPRALYNYRQQRAGSIMTVSIREKNVRDIIDAFEARIEFFEQYGEDELVECAKAAYYRELLSYYYVVNTKLDDKDAQKRLSLEIEKKLHDGSVFIKNCSILTKWRKKYYVFFYLRTFSLKLYRMRNSRE